MRASAGIVHVQRYIGTTSRVPEDSGRGRWKSFGCAVTRRRYFRSFDALASAGAITRPASHRFSAVRMGDLIHVAAEDRMVESGTHEQLMALGEVCAELYDRQAAAYS